MISYYKTEDNITRSIETLEKHCWINMINPDAEEIEYVATTLGIEKDFLLSALDEEESSRIEVEDNNQILTIIDIPVAEEAAVTAQVLGNNVVRLYDVGVSGIHRLLSHMDIIMSAKVIVAVAGMEGALPSVIGGLADCPVIAVPTSVGYGASLGGIAALLSMLNSCASGVAAVNIDNGFGAGYMASMINHLS